MADKKISQLTALAAANLAPSTDVLAIVDTSATETKKIVAQDLVNGVLNVASAVGIGTASPTSKLHVVGTGTYVATFNNSSDDTRIELQKSGTQYGQISVSTTSLNLVGSQSNTAIKFIVNSGTTTAVTIDSSGNLGLGVTPSAWRSTEKAMQIGQWMGLFSDSGLTAELSSNMYISSGNQFVYTNTGAATRYRQYLGAHSWFTAASGTAGNTISFTQALTLDASGNLIGGGKTSASLTTAGFELASDGSLCSTKSSTNTNLATNNGGSLQLANSSATDGNFSNIGAYNSNGLVVSQIDFINVSHASRTGDIAFLTHNGSSLLERARITSGGDFLVGTTVAPDGTANYGGGFVSTTNSRRELYLATSSTSANNLARFYNPNGEVGNIQTNGTATAFNTSSDRRLKENIAPADDAGAIVDAIQVVKHDWKAGGHTRYGMIAQDLHEVAPEAVSAGDNGEEIIERWSVDYSKLVPMLVKELQSVRARLAALETK